MSVTIRPAAGRGTHATAGHFPHDHAALKVLYLIAIRHRPNRPNLVGQIHGWKAILNTLTIHYGERISEAFNP